jgi:hypothetical protein
MLGSRRGGPSTWPTRGALPACAKLKRGQNNLSILHRRPLAVCALPGASRRPPHRPPQPGNSRGAKISSRRRTKRTVDSQHDPSREKLVRTRQLWMFERVTVTRLRRAVRAGWLRTSGPPYQCRRRGLYSVQAIRRPNAASEIVAARTTRINMATPPFHLVASCCASCDVSPGVANRSTSLPTRRLKRCSPRTFLFGRSKASRDIRA